MKVLVTGGSGQVGSEVIRVLKARGISCYAPTHDEMDITDAGSVMRAFEMGRPSQVIHCAAWTRVDDAERMPAECFAVNAQGTANVAQACLRYGCEMVYVSTDYVFGNGVTDEPHEVDEAPAPLNVYGLSKLQGEVAVHSLLSRYYIVRAEWIYSADRPGFVNSISTKGAKGEALRVVDDQRGTPTWSRDLAEALVDLLQTRNYGYHAAVPQGSCTWYGFAKAILQAQGINARVMPVRTEDWAAPAKRPVNSLMVPTIVLPRWEESLQKALEQM